MSAHPTVALLLPHIHDYTHGLQWLGALDACQSAGARLITLPGGALRDPTDFTAQANALYDLLGPAQAEAVVVGTSSLGVFVDQDELIQFCLRFRPRPIVTFQTPLHDFPAVVTADYQGMRTLLAHLVEEHGARRLAFLRGPERHLGFRERYRAFRDAVAAYHLPAGDHTVTPPTHWRDAARAIGLLLDDWGLRPGRDLDAIVASSDGLAIAALHALRARGIRVPDDVFVTGFDQNVTPAADLPALTTVRSAFYEVGSVAVGRVLQLARGEAVPAITPVPARLIVRESCGCWQASTTAELPLSPSWAPDPALAARLARALRHDLDAGSLTVLAVVREALRSAAGAGRPLTSLPSVVAEARRVVLADLAPGASHRAEDLLHRVRDLIDEKLRQDHEHRRQLLELRAEHVRDLGRLLNATADLREFMDVVATELPQLGVPAAALITFDPAPADAAAPPPPERPARVAMAYTAAGRLELPPGGLPMRPAEFLPGLLSDAPGFVVEPLFYRDELLGYVTLAVGPRDGALYGALREELRGALKGAQLFQEARAAQRTAEEADQLKSRFLSTVSHELRTPLNVIIGLSELLAQQGAADVRALPSTMRQDLERLQISARQLDALIRDVVDLARSQVGQLRLRRTPLDVRADVLEPVAAVGARLAAEKGLHWHVAAPAGPLPWLVGDGARLQQVLLNLVTNAVKFTARGEVSLQLGVTPGALQIRVSDTGLGIPPAELDVIFDAFRQSERTTARGFGGMGLGLAVAREIVELHDGRIAAQSPADGERGTCITVHLPTIVEAAGDLSAVADRDGPVVVLSEGGGAELHAQLTAQRVAALELRADGPTWLAAVAAAGPAAVLIDEPLAAARGWELLTAVKAQPALRDVPVLFARLRRGHDGGTLLAFDYLAKPIEPAALAQLLDRQGLTGDGPPPTVLIVDDDDATRELHTRLVRTCAPASRVLQAADGHTALGLLEQDLPDLLLLDLMMPELDGFGVLEALRAQERTRDIPVVVLSAQSLSDTEMARLTRNVAAVLHKGVFSTAETVARIVAALASGRRSGGEARRLVRRAMAYIHMHYHDPISSEAIAGALGVSGRHLARAFQQELGISPLTYLNRYRIRQACALFEEPARSVAEIALAVGFADTAYFSRMFRREVGVAPRAYQQGERPQPITDA